MPLPEYTTLPAPPPVTSSVTRPVWLSVNRKARTRWLSPQSASVAQAQPPSLEMLVPVIVTAPPEAVTLLPVTDHDPPELSHVPKIRLE